MSSFHNAVFSSFTEGSFSRGEGQRGGASSLTSGRVVYRLVALTQRVRDDRKMLGEACKLPNPNLILKTKTHVVKRAGKRRWMIQREAPLRPGGWGGAGGRGHRGLLFRNYVLQSAARR